MDRRTLLRHTAGLAATGTIGLAGCVDGTGDAPTETDEPGPVVDVTSVDETAIETTSTDCASGDVGVANLEKDPSEHSLTVTGTIRAPTPCHEAVLASTILATDTLTIAVDVASDGSGTCVQCVGAIEYEATVTLTEALEGTVVVQHGTGDDGTEILRESAHL